MKNHIHRILFLVGAFTLLTAAALPAANFSNPVLPGDRPDPSVIRVGDDYWATATTSEWAPLFPILHSRDLVNWELVGNIFERRPEWAVGNFWAPELFHHQGKYFAYYVGRKKGGPLALAVATADKPTGPWTDHGPLISQDAGSIDAFVVADTNGDLCLIWKEDGNSRRLPTPLWIQKLSPDGIKLVGEMKEIFHNDATWERNLVEGPAVVRRGEYWYMFYSAAACCGRDCSYVLGVAQARDLFGPWEKFAGNPILVGNDQWKCPGHGTVVSDKQGQDWLLYHAYDAKTFIYVGRQGLLDRVTWGADGWPKINDGQGPSSSAAAPIASVVQKSSHDFMEDFNAPRLKPQWQWPQNTEPRAQVGGGNLILSSEPARKDALVAGIVAVNTTTGDYTATTELNPRGLKPGQSAGLSAFGDHANALGVSLQDGQLVVWKRQRSKQEMLSTNAAPAGAALTLRMNATSGHRFSFSASANGKTWKSLGDNVDVEGNYLPPWDRGIRVALIVGGENASVEFRSLRIVAKDR
jgi:xylan 1,4-beta-xylosidase